MNGKVYIGKSNDIEKRFWVHKNSLVKPDVDKRRVNRHLYNAVQKYGIDNFEFIILEELPDSSEAELADSEIAWIEKFNSTDRDFGYNLMKDSSQKTIVHEETKRLLSERSTGEGNANYGNYWTDEQKSRMSDIKKKQFESGIYDFMKTDEYKTYISELSKNLWKNEEKKLAMAKKVSEATSIYRFYQYCKNTGELVRIWNSIGEIIEENPDYHRIAIYSVCNGWKKSYRGFVWRSELKVDNAEPED